MAHYTKIAVQSRPHSLDDDFSRDNIAVNIPLTNVGSNRRRSTTHTDKGGISSRRHSQQLRSSSDINDDDDDDDDIRRDNKSSSYSLFGSSGHLNDELDGDGDQRGLLSGSIKYHTSKKSIDRERSDDDIDVDDASDDEDTQDFLSIMEHQTAGIMESFLNMANSIVGAGIIGLPYSFRESGFWSGIILLVILTGIVDWTVGLLIKNSRMSSKQSYQDLMEFCYGRAGLWAISIFQFIFAFGAMCAYNVIIGDTIPSVFIATFPSIVDYPILSLLASRRAVIFLCTIGITFPLSLYRDIAKLAKASAFALVALAIIIFAVMIEAPRTRVEEQGDPTLRWTFINPEIFQSIGVICFAFVCHHNTFVILNALKSPSLKRFSVVTHLSMGVSLITCLLMATSGYWAFTDKTEGNVLNNFAHNNILINIARLCFGMNMFSTLPLEHFVVREVVEVLFLKEPITMLTNFILTTILIGAALIVALTTCDLGFVMELTGGISATALAFILPPACYVKLASGPLWSRKKLPSLVCIVFGVIVMCLSTTLSIQDYFYNTGKRKICQW